MSGQEDLDKQTQHQERGEAGGVPLASKGVTDAIGRETLADEGQPVPGAQIREIYADDTAPDDQPS